MDEATIQTLIHLSYVVAAALFVIGLHRMNSPATARNGNIVSAVGMAIAVAAAGIDVATPPPASSCPASRGRSSSAA